MTIAASYVVPYSFYQYLFKVGVV